MVKPSIDDCRWKRISGFSDYYVHPHGYVKSVKIRSNKYKKTITITQKILSIFIIKGYSSVNSVQSNPYKRKSARIHILVAEAFIGKRPKNCDVMHLDGNRQNPNLTNLRYGSRKCNEAFKIDHGTALIGENHHQAKLTEKDVLEIREKFKNGGIGTKIAIEYGISHSMAIRIKNKRSWKCV